MVAWHQESSQFNPTAVLPGPLHLLIDTSLMQKPLAPWLGQITQMILMFFNNLVVALEMEKCFSGRYSSVSVLNRNLKKPAVFFGSIFKNYYRSFWNSSYENVDGLGSWLQVSLYQNLRECANCSGCSLCILVKSSQGVTHRKHHRLCCLRQRTFFSSMRCLWRCKPLQQRRHLTAQGLRVGV